MKLFVVVVVSIFMAGGLAAQPTSADVDVRSVVSGFHAALSAGDAAKALSLVADDVIFLEAGGVETRAEYEKNHLPLDIAFEKGVSIKRTPIRVVVVGDAAWATSTSEMKGTYAGRAIDSFGAELMVLSRGPAGSKIRSVHWSGRARAPKP